MSKIKRCVISDQWVSEWVSEWVSDKITYWAVCGQLKIQRLKYTKTNEFQLRFKKVYSVWLIDHELMIDTLYNWHLILKYCQTFQFSISQKIKLWWWFRRFWSLLGCGRICVFVFVFDFAGSHDYWGVGVWRWQTLQHRGQLKKTIWWKCVL